MFQFPLKARLCKPAVGAACRRPLRRGGRLHWHVLTTRTLTAIIFCFAVCTSPSLALPPDDREYALAINNGNEYQSHHHFHDAFRCFEHAKELQPKQWEPYFHVGDVLIALDDSKGAVDVLQQGIKINPKQPDLYCTLSQAHYGVGDVKAALADMDRAIALDNRRGPFFERRAQLYEIFNEHEKAVQDYTSSMDLYSPSKSNHAAGTAPQIDEVFRLAAGRGNVYMKMGKYQNAIDDYTLYLKAPAAKKSNILRILHSRAECYDKLGKHDLAAKDRSAAENHKGDILEDLMHDPTIGAGK
jgi:tetratricopeptide (TPR) repeat protein